MKVDLPSIKNRENANTHSIKVNIYFRKTKNQKNEYLYDRLITPLIVKPSNLKKKSKINLINKISKIF